jgi:trehalose utilization protein
MPDPIRATIWNEHLHEQKHETVRRIYPTGIHEAIAAPLRAAGCAVATATLDQPEHGLTDAVLARTDVLFWWGHMAHGRVEDAIVDRVQRRVLEGMGLVVLHSGHYAKIFKRLLGTTCSLKWREVHERERFWVVKPGHPLVAGIGEGFVVPHSEMYGEPFGIPEPDEQVGISWYEGGEVFRSLCVFRRGNGIIVYFSPGHETYPIYHQPEVQRVLLNAARFAAKTERIPDTCPQIKVPPETVRTQLAGVVAAGVEQPPG